MQTTACPPLSPDFRISRKTTIASSTTAEIESATAVHLHQYGRDGQHTWSQQVHTHRALRIITIRANALIGAQQHEGRTDRYDAG
ncbi:hypothetical protein GCM10010392_04430 [Streptomyces clavifer]|nr:hypothetical protein GCM10010392_04430 [Streptomyces clavifer]